jgi:hypothetical protein
MVVQLEYNCRWWLGFLPDSWEKRKEVRLMIYALSLFFGHGTN